MARGIVPTLTCDYCKTVQVVNDANKDIPAGWLQIAIGCESGTGKADKGKIDLCGEACCERWAKERRKALGTHSDNGATFQCPVCDDVMAPKGKGTHLGKHVNEGVITEAEAAEMVAGLKSHA